MEVSGVRRVSSAGYRLPERSNGTRPLTAQPGADRSRRAPRGEPGSDPDRKDTVKQDQVWREALWSERRAAREWEKNWDFLRNYDQMGQPKTHSPLPSSVSLFSDRVPNTSNQVFGSRLSSPLGSELVRLQQLLLLSGSHRRRKQDPEILPY